MFKKLLALCILPNVVFANECVIGDIQLFAFDFDIQNFEMANGSNLSKTEYPELASLLNNRFGGNSNSVAVPNIGPIQSLNKIDLNYRICTKGDLPQRKLHNQNNSDIQTIGVDFGKVIPLSEDFVPQHFLPANGGIYQVWDFPKLSEYIHYNFCYYKTEFCTPKLKSLETVDHSQKLEYSVYASDQPRVDECIIGEISLFPFEPDKLPPNFPYKLADGSKVTLNSDTMVLYSLIGEKYGYDKDSNSYYLPNIKPITKNVNYYICANGRFPTRK